MPNLTPDLRCKTCKHYEANHRYPNPNATAWHYCKKCKEEIKYIRTGTRRTPWIPKMCYFNDYYEHSDEYKKLLKEREVELLRSDFGLMYQVED